MLDAFSQVCADADVGYFVDSGTLLGAVRHQGWIPWDDDIDVAMLRDDYERLRSYVIAYQPLPGDISFSDLRSNSAHVTSTPRLLYLRSERGHYGRVRKSEPPEFRHIALDVFVLDHAPLNSVLRRLWLQVVRLAELLVMARATGLPGVLRSDESTYVRKAVELAAIAFSRVLTAQRWRALHHSSCTLWRPTGGYVVTMYNNRRQRTLLFMHDQLAPSRPGRFENRQVPLPHDWDAILTGMYGKSYMTPPPRDGQRPLHFRDRLAVDLDGRVADVTTDRTTTR